MAEQHLERPPAYYNDEPVKRSQENPTRTSTRDYEGTPTLESLSMAATTRQHLPHTDVKNSDFEQKIFKSPIVPLNPPPSVSTAPIREMTERGASITSISNAMSVDGGRQDQSVAPEDLDERMAAEALCGLGKIEPVRAPRPRTPSGYETPLKYYPFNISHTRSATSQGNGETEPLLSLLTSTHPWLGGTISGSMSAYSSTKHHSPRFVQHSADFVEKHIGTPVASTVSSVGRKTGVEGSLRRFLGAKQHSEHSADLIDPEILGDDSPTSNKRRRISSEADDSDIAMGLPIQRTLSGNVSVDTLPIYDDNRSPAYEANDPSSMQVRQRPSISRSWSTQLMISTSGLGAALNEASLRSLKYVLHMLKSANVHVGDLMERLRKLLQDFDAGRTSDAEAGAEKNGSDGQSNHTVAQRIQHLNEEIWRTLKQVVTTVSRYTGGALPENASVIVRWQLMSVPRRWQKVVNDHSNAPTEANEKGETSQTEKEAVTSAHRMLAFAHEGLDMMEQVGGVVSSTIDSAEKWLDTMGRKKQNGQSRESVNLEAGPVVESSAPAEDVQMGETNTNGHASQTPEDGMLVDATS